MAAVPAISEAEAVQSLESARIFRFWRHFPAKKAGFHFARKCSKTSAATVNRCGSGFPGRRPARHLPTMSGARRQDRSCREPFSAIGASPSGKAGDFDSPMRRFESSRPSHLFWKLQFFGENARKARHCWAFVIRQRLSCGDIFQYRARRFPESLEHKKQFPESGSRSFLRFGCRKGSR